MTVDDALQLADEWTRGHTFYEGSDGWRVAIAILAAEIRRLKTPIVERVIGHPGTPLR